MNVLERQEIVRSFECGADNRQRPDSLLGWIMDTAEDHATILNIGREFCIENNLSWVEFRLSVRIKRLPLWKQAVMVSTWTAPTSPVIATRDFIMKDLSGEIMVEAGCQWVIIDAKTRQPLPLKRKLSNLMEMTMSPLFPKPKKVMFPVGGRCLRTFCSDWHNIDFNGHTNNAVYLVWALDTLPLDFMQKNALKGIEISFKKETFAGEKVESYYQYEAPYTYHELRVGESIRATLRLEWSCL